MNSERQQTRETQDFETDEEDRAWPDRRLHSVLRRLSTLIIHQNVVVQSALYHELAALGAGGILGTNSVSASLAAMRQGNFNVLIIQHDMEPVDGLALAARLRQGPASDRGAVPIILLSPDSGRQTDGIARRLGVDVISDPTVHPKAVCRRICQLAQMRETMPAADWPWHETGGEPHGRDSGAGAA